MTDLIGSKSGLLSTVFTSECLFNTEQFKNFFKINITPIGNSSVEVAVMDCFQSSSFPSLSNNEGFGLGFGPFVGIMMELKGK